MLITYTIEIPEEHVMELSDFMLERRIEFNHRADVTASAPRVRQNHTLMGGEAEEILTEINRYLIKLGMSPEIQGPAASWDIPVLQDFLDLAGCNFQWNDGKILEPEQPPDWNLIVRDTPRVFVRKET